ncbi:acetyl-CoA carboxylase biotin carboxyl carrier protein [Elusimicrobiota bacterium]
MNNEKIKKFLEGFQETDIEELKIESKGQKIYFRKSEVPAVNIQTDASKAKAQAEMNKIKPVKAPMVGTFYHSRSADHPPFVVNGDNIKPGQKIGIIETMKIIKDVTSSLEGKIVQVSVKDGQSVEYGQELFLVDTSISKKEQNGKK